MTIAFSTPPKRRPSLLVRASAGTGKTYRLTGRLLNLLFAGAPVESVLASTFTRKAAGEILQRLLTTLAAAAHSEDPATLTALRQQAEDDSITRAQCVKLLHTIVRDIHRLRIGTLDSLFSQLARAFPFELGMPPGWRLLDENEERWTRASAITAMLAAADRSEIMSLLAMLSKGELKRSVAREIDQVVTAAYDVSRACDLQAWQSLRPPAAPPEADLTRAAGYLLTAAIGHKTGDKKLQQIGGWIESRQPEALAGQPLIREALAMQTGHKDATYYRKPLPSEIVEALVVGHQYATSHVLGLLAEQSRATGQVLQDYDAAVTHLKQASRGLAFADVALRLSRWIDGQPGETIGYRLDGMLEHVLLDEFQDTSPEQWRVLRPLANRAAANAQHAKPDVSSSFFCVGDTKQAIYAWRGGVAAIFDSVTQQIPGVQVEQMARSYRSSPVIMETVTKIFQNLTRHPVAAEAFMPDRNPADPATYEADAIAQFAKDFPEHSAAIATKPGYVQIQSGPEPESEADDAKRTLLRYVADQVADLHAKLPTQTIGILTRRNVTVGQLIYLLRRLGVEVSQEGGNPLTDSGAVELLLSAVMLVEHPGDGRWWYHLRHSPLATHRWFQDLHADAAPPPSDDAVHAAALQRRIADQHSHLAAARLRRQFEDHGLVVTLRDLADAVAPACDASDTLRMRQLLQLAQQFERNPQPRLRDFVDQVYQQRVERPQPARVRVMTVYQAKGLEFDAVVLPELDGNLVRRPPQCIPKRPQPAEPPEAMLRYLSKDYWPMLPDAWQAAFGAATAEQMTEALCVLYVALTRPRHGLYLYPPPVTLRQPHKQKSAAMLLHAALGCDADPAAPETRWFETGDPEWYLQTNAP